MAAALFVCAAAIAAAEEGAVAERRSLASAGCNNCCFQNVRVAPRTMPSAVCESAPARRLCRARLL
jgi:hypothetical protein